MGGLSFDALTRLEKACRGIEYRDFDSMRVESKVYCSTGSRCSQNNFLKSALRFLSFVLYLVLLCNVSVAAGEIKGTAFDSTSGKAIKGVTIRVEGTGQSMATNAVGQYRLLLSAGTYQLRFSHIGYNSILVEVQLSDSGLINDVQMTRVTIRIPGINVFDRQFDPAQEIIAKAIARKKEILKRLKSYEVKAHAKFIGADNKAKDSGEIKYIIESQLICLWSQPDKYTETIVARRQSANIDPEMNLLATENIPDFNRNRVEFERYSIVTPTATDALEYYDYYLIDTLLVDGIKVYRLEVVPKNDVDPLLKGTIDIADSSYEVVGLKGGVSEGVVTPFVKNIRYRQSFHLLEERYWMPTFIQFQYDVSFPFPFNIKLSVDYSVALYDYKFDVEPPKGAFDFPLEVDKNADSYDSAAWYGFQTITLTPEETEAYRRIDSVANLPKPIYKHFLKPAEMLLYHFDFNRVEGVKLKYRKYWYNPLPRVELDMKFGYAFSRDYVPHRFGVYYRLREREKFYVGAEYHNEIVHREAIFGKPDLNTFIRAFFAKVSSYDYYFERGVRLRFISEINKKIEHFLIYQDSKVTSEITNTDYAFFAKNKSARPNLPIREGRFRALSTILRYDSRAKIKLKDKERYQYEFSYSILKLKLEYSSPDFLNSDFNYLKYHFSGIYRGRTILPGFTKVQFFIGGSDKNLPPHRYYMVNNDYQLLGGNLYFRTLGQNSFSGNRVAAVYLSHNFSRWLFKKSGLPLIKQIPFTASVIGGAFFTEFKNHNPQPGDDQIRSASTAYQEIGFRIGGILEYGFSFDFVWQLSDYDTNKFSWGFRIFSF